MAQCEPMQPNVMFEALKQQTIITNQQIELNNLKRIEKERLLTTEECYRYLDLVSLLGSYSS